MIHEFNARRLIFAPLGFLNGVARWILGVHSSDGSVLIKNTATPGRDGSVDLRVNFDALYAKVARRIDRRNLTEVEITRIKNIVKGFIDGVTLSCKGEHIGVDEKWFEDAVKKYVEELTGGDSGTVDDELESGFSGVLPLDKYAEKKTDSKTFGKDAEDGIKVFVACRGADGGEDGSIFFRQFTISKTGAILGIGAETQAMGVYTNQ